MADTPLHSMTQLTTPPDRASELYVLLSPFSATYDRRSTVGNLLDKLIYWSDTAPSSPTADDLWWETDTNILWTYGTYAGASRWVSAEVFSSFGGAQTAATAAAFIHTGVANGMNAGYDVYIQGLYFKHYVITTNNGSNYWTCTLRKVTTTTAPATGAGTSLGTCNTSASSAGTWTEVTASIDAVIDFSGSGMELPFLDLTFGAGTPGSMWYSLGVSYRLVHP